MFYDLLRCLRNICVVVELTRCGNVRGWRICLFVAPLMPSFLPVNAKPFWFLWFYNANIWPRRCSICSFFCSFPVPPHFFFFSVVLSFFHSVPQKCFLFMCQRSDDSNLLVFLINLGIISSYHFPYNFLQTFGGFCMLHQPSSCNSFYRTLELLSLQDMAPVLNKATIT